MLRSTYIVTLSILLSACQIEVSDDVSTNESKNDNEINTQVNQVEERQSEISLIAPDVGSVISNDTTTFEFSMGDHESGWLYVGSQAKANDIYDGQLKNNVIDINVPLNGETLFVTVWAEREKEWVSKQYQFETIDKRVKQTQDDAKDTVDVNEDQNYSEDTASNNSENSTNSDEQSEKQEPSLLTFPLKGTVLESSGFSLTVSHLANSWVYLGSSVGSRDIANVKLEQLNYSAELPSDLKALHVTLWSYIDNVWHHTQYVFETGFLSSNDDTGNNQNKEDHKPNTNMDDQVQLSYADILILFNRGARSSIDEDAWSVNAVDYLNQTLENSDTSLRFRLAGVEHAPVQYDRTLTSADPERMKTDADIQSLKEQYGADIVGMLTDSAQDWCGYSKIPKSNVEEGTIIHTNSQYFWNLLRCGYRNFTHEVGHSIGLRHSVKESPKPSGNHTWARGYGVYNRFSTMMGYASSYNKGWGNELPIFSNPKIVECDGMVCGIERHHNDGADSAYFINQMGAALENLNESKLSAPVPLEY